MAVFAKWSQLRANPNIANITHVEVTPYQPLVAPAAEFAVNFLERFRHINVGEIVSIKPRPGVGKIGAERIAGQKKGFLEAIGIAVKGLVEKSLHDGRVIRRCEQPVGQADAAYFRQAEQSIPRLSALYPDFTGDDLMMNGSSPNLEPDDARQMSLVLAEQPAK